MCIDKCASVIMDSDTVKLWIKQSGKKSLVALQYIDCAYS